MTLDPEPEVVEARPCCNYREDVDRPCRGTQRFRAGDLQAACDECGGWCGIDAPCRPVEGELLPPVDPHAITAKGYAWGAAWTCACGEWEAVATGPSSARWAADDHRRHVHAATRPAGDA